MKKRFLVTSILMLLLTVFALSTSTYAWFSMNTNVSATGLAVVAKTDDTYLLISKTEGITQASTIQAENEGKGNITVAMGMTVENSKVYASTPCLDDTQTGYLTTAGKDIDGETITTPGVIVNSAATAAAATNWYTAKAEDATASTMEAGSARQLTEDAFSDYVIKKTVYLTVAKGANDAWNLRVKGVFTQEGSGEDVSACKVIVATDKGGFAILAKEATPAYHNIYVADDSNIITDTTVVRVDLYIFYDGTDSSVYTNNAAKLTGATFTLSFEVDAKPAA